MRSVRQRICLVTAICIAAPPATANILEADFAGVAAGPFNCTDPFDCFYTSHPAPYTAKFVFDTTKGSTFSPSPGTFQLAGGGSGTQSPWISGNLIIEGIDYFPFLYSGPASLTWHITDIGETVLDSASAFGDSSYYFYGFTDTGPSYRSPRYGFFQIGNCGTHCGDLSVVSFSLTDISPAPSPIVGSGLPALAFFGGFIAWLKRRVKRQAPSACMAKISASVLAIL